MTLTSEPTSSPSTVVRLIAVVVVINLVVWVAGIFAPDGSVSGPDGSSYVTTGQGAAAVAGLMERLGVEVRRARLPIDEFDLDPTATLVLIDVNEASYSPAELTSMDSFVRAGGRLVVVGAAAFVERLLVDPPVWRSAGATSAVPQGDLANRPGLSTLRLSGFGSLDPTDEDSPILTGNDLTVAVKREVGEGSFLWVADSGPFHNDRIGRNPSANFVVELLGIDSPIIFDEFRHGYTDRAGFWQLLSPRWRLAIILSFVTVAIALVAYGRRFGPPHDMERRLAPGRERYLEAVAGILGRAHSTTEALETIRAEARNRLHLSPHESVSAAAGETGLSAEDVEALDGDRTDDETLLRADRALAALIKEKE